MAFRKIFFIVIAVFFFSGALLASSNGSHLYIDNEAGWFGLKEYSRESVAFNPVTASHNEQAMPEKLQCDIDFHEHVDESEDGEYPDWLETVWGTPARNHLYLGMWAYHFQKGDDHDWNNQLIAMAYKGYYGGTFINSHSDRVWSLGVQRTWSQQQYGVLDIELGYRLGMMYGYKKYLRLFDTPFFPLFQVVADIEYNNVGIQVSWAGVVATIGFLYRF